MSHRVGRQCEEVIFKSPAGPLLPADAQPVGMLSPLASTDTVLPYLLTPGCCLSLSWLPHQSSLDGDHRPNRVARVALRRGGYGRVRATKPVQLVHRYRSSGTNTRTTPEENKWKCCNTSCSPPYHNRRQKSRRPRPIAGKVSRLPSAAVWLAVWRIACRHGDGRQSDEASQEPSAWVGRGHCKLAVWQEETEVRCCSLRGPPCGTEARIAAGEVRSLRSWPPNRRICCRHLTTSSSSSACAPWPPAVEAVVSGHAGVSA